MNTRDGARGGYELWHACHTPLFAHPNFIVAAKLLPFPSLSVTLALVFAFSNIPYKTFLNCLTWGPS